MKINVKIKVDAEVAKRIKKELGIDLKKAFQEMADKLIPTLILMADLKKQHPEMDLKTIAERLKQNESAKT